MSPQAIIERIQKLLALATSSNEHEAGEAMARAQQMLAEHNLSMEALGSDAAEVVGECPVPLDASRRMASWKVQLALAVAAHTGTNVFARGPALMLVGTPTDCEGARAMFNWLSLQLVRLSYQDCTGQGRSYFSQWLMGAVVGIRGQLKRIRAAEQATTVPGAVRTTGLVTMDHARAARAWMDSHLRLKTSTSRFHAKDGFRAGAAAGGSMSLRPSGSINGRAAIGCR